MSSMAEKQVDKLFKEEQEGSTNYVEFDSIDLDLNF